MAFLRGVIRVLDLMLMVMRFDFPRERKQFPAELRQRLYVQQDGRCVYCGEAFGSGLNRMTIDHIVPVSAGGSDKESNLQGLCRECNGWKADHSDQEFRERIQEGLVVLGIERCTLDRKLLKRLMKSTRIHENVRRRRTTRFRLRIVLLFASFFLLVIAGGYFDFYRPVPWKALEPIAGTMDTIAWVLFFMLFMRAKWRGYLRWNPARDSEIPGRKFDRSKRPLFSWW